MQNIKISVGDAIAIPSKEIPSASVSGISPGGTILFDCFERVPECGPYNRHWSGDCHPDEVIKLADAQALRLCDVITARRYAPDPIRGTTEGKCRMAVVLRVHADGACTVGVIDDGPFLSGARRPQIFMNFEQMKGMMKVDFASIEDFPTEYEYYFGVNNPTSVDWKNSIIPPQKSR